MPWNIYRSDGTTLLKKGLRITSEKNLDRLLQGELLRDADDEDDTEQSTEVATESTNNKTSQSEPDQSLKNPDNPFEWIDYFALQLKQIYNNIHAEEKNSIEQIHNL